MTMKNKYAKRSRILRGQGPRAGSLLRRRSDSPPGGDAERSEPQHREPALPRLAGTHPGCLRGPASAVRGRRGRRGASSGHAGSRGRRGRGAYGKTVVFGIFERHGQVYTEIVPDCSKPTLQGIIRGPGSTSAPSSTPMAGGGYDGLVDLGYGHFRVDHSSDEVHQRRRPHQRHRRLLGPRQGPAGEVQGTAQTHLPPAPQGNRMALQQSTRRQVPNHAKISPPKPP